jgi:UDP-2-acetamido-2-deoxy-ribo-hexuluronate aminotransferase
MRCGVPVAIHYPRALHEQPAFVCGAVLPESARAAREVLTLPLHPYLTMEAVDMVVAAVNAFAHAGR